MKDSAHFSDFQETEIKGTQETNNHDIPVSTCSTDEVWTEKEHASNKTVCPFHVIKNVSSN